jgi:hypothetical protein
MKLRTAKEFEPAVTPAQARRQPRTARMTVRRLIKRSFFREIDIPDRSKKPG